MADQISRFFHSKKRLNFYFSDKKFKFHSTKCQKKLQHTSNKNSSCSPKTKIRTTGDTGEIFVWVNFFGHPVLIFPSTCYVSTFNLHQLPNVLPESWSPDRRFERWSLSLVQSRNNRLLRLLPPFSRYFSAAQSPQPFSGHRYGTIPTQTRRCSLTALPDCCPDLRKRIYKREFQAHIFCLTFPTWQSIFLA